MKLTCKEKTEQSLENATSELSVQLSERQVSSKPFLRDSLKSQRSLMSMSGQISLLLAFRDPLIFAQCGQLDTRYVHLRFGPRCFHLKSDTSLTSVALLHVLWHLL